MIRDRILFSTSGKLQELLLRKRNLDLSKAIEICQAHEATQKYAKEMCEAGPDHSVNKVNKSQGKTGINSRIGESSEGMFSVKCRFCGYVHELNKAKCPAWGKTCDGCKGKNHFKAVCKKTVKIVKEDYDSVDDRDHYMWMTPVETKNSPRLTALLILNDTEVRFHLDTGADVNAICQKYVKKDQVRPTSVKLSMWNGSKLLPLGETTLEVINPKNSESKQVSFIVVPNNLMCLIGSKTCQDLGFVSVNSKTFITKVEINHENSDLGNLGEAKLHIDTSLQAKVLPCRRLPVSLNDKVQIELNLLVERGVLIPECEPTEWVSQMAVVQKANGKLRI